MDNWRIAADAVLRFGRVNMSQVYGAEASYCEGGRNVTALNRFYWAISQRQSGSKSTTKGITSARDIYDRPRGNTDCMQGPFGFVPHQHTLCSHLDHDDWCRKVCQVCECAARIIVPYEVRYLRAAW